MKFEINSSDINFNGKDLKSFFDRINDACAKTKTSYFIVGAFARDLVLENIFNETTGIATKDIDIAIRMNDWEKFDSFITYLKLTHGFKNGKVAHEFISPEEIFTDIIPYGQIESNRLISFPLQDNRAINMLGFQEIYDSTLEIVLDSETELKVASIEGIAILKLIAWKDRKPASISEKHTRDIGFLIKAYFDAMVEDFAVEFSDLFDEEDFDPLTCGARALGRRIKQLINMTLTNELETELNNLFEELVVSEDNSLFVIQLSNAFRWKYPLALKIVKHLILGFQEIKK